jgi:hypothetical protein
MWSMPGRFSGPEVGCNKLQSAIVCTDICPELIQV